MKSGSLANKGSRFFGRVPHSYDRKMSAGRANATATRVENSATLDEILERWQMIAESQGHGAATTLRTRSPIGVWCRLTAWSQKIETKVGDEEERRARDQRRSRKAGVRGRHCLLTTGGLLCARRCQPSFERCSSYGRCLLLVVHLVGSVLVASSSAYRHLGR